MKELKIGLLPLYLKLYDDTSPQGREAFLPFLEVVITGFQKRGVEVLTSEICRLSSEFAQAVELFEESEVDCIVTLHLAYSPSLESINALSKTKLPILVLDTTMDVHADPDADTGWIMHNHGIHGVQDMCNMLIRCGKDFVIEVGHIETSDVLDRLVRHIKGAKMANQMRSARVGRIGESFAGMGDFTVEPTLLQEAIGVTVCAAAPQQIAEFLPEAAAPEVEAELEKDRVQFDVSQVKPESHSLAVRTGLAVRRWIEKEALTAVTVNFLEITKSGKLPVMPFLEISKAMSRGIGYAGEGDVLTAALVGALTSVLDQVSFTEMFCPDWQDGVIFLGHMGEINVDLAGAQPVLLEKKWAYTDAEPPVFASAALKPGEAVFVDLAPGPDDAFSLIMSLVTLLDEASRPKLTGMVRGWMKPRLPIESFLAAYSEAGGTHHAAIVYGDVIPELSTFGRMMGWRVVVVE
jgi:L-arabinose isomerase